MKPPTFKQLLEGATQGPWRGDRLCVESTTKGNVCLVNLARASETDAQYIARLDPPTMKLVVEALEGVINSTVHPDKALRAVLVDLAPIRKAIAALNRQ